MRLTAELRYPDADAGAVFAMLTTKDFHEAKCRANGALEYEVDVQRFDDGSATVTTHRTMPTDQVPEFVRAFVGSALRVTEIDDWGPAEADGSRAGTVVVELGGAPVRLTGSLRLAAVAAHGTDGAAGAGVAGTVELVDGDLTASVPLVGGRIERAAEPAIRAAIRVEERTGLAWLAGRER